MFELAWRRFLGGGSGSDCQRSPWDGGGHGFSLWLENVVGSGIVGGGGRAWAWDLEMDGWMVLIPRDVAREGCNLLLNGNQDDPSFHLLVEERFVE